MTPADLQRMRDTPGLHTVAQPDGSVVVIASIDEKLYAMIPGIDEKDIEWHPGAQLERCIFCGTVARVGKR